MIPALAGQAIALDHVGKSFAGVPALADVSLTIAPGTVHGVLGENGAGKSTALNILYGLLQPDAGSVRIGDLPVRVASPRAARGLGFGMVHQHFALAPTLTVADNLALAWGRGVGPVDRPTIVARAKALARELGWHLDPAAPVGALSVGAQQRVEIVKALGDGARLLILDEPTAVLTPQEADELLPALRRLAARGTAIAFITHKLPEAERVCDVVSILRRGRLAYSGPLIERAEMARLMVGAEPPMRAAAPRPAPDDAPVRLRLTAVTATAAGQRIARIDLAVRAGEVVGVAGVDGNGQPALAQASLGLGTAEGAVERAGTLGTQALAVIPDDRRSQALALPLSVVANLHLKGHATPPAARRGWLHPAAWRERARRLVERFAVRAASIDQPVATLSGGNQQKVVLARELDGDPALIVAVNPTRGLDLGASAAVLAALAEARARGAGVLLIHSDLDELLSIADRVLVLRAGGLIDSGWPACDRARIGRLMLDGDAA